MLAAITRAGVGLRQVRSGILFLLAALLLLLGAGNAWAIAPFNGFTCAANDSHQQSAGPFISIAASSATVHIAAGEQLGITVLNGTSGTIVRQDNLAVIIDLPGTSIATLTGPLDVTLTVPDPGLDSQQTFNISVTFACSPTGNGGGNGGGGNPPPPPGSATLFLDQNAAAGVQVLTGDMDAVQQMQRQVAGGTNCDQLKADRDRVSDRIAELTRTKYALEDELDNLKGGKAAFGMVPDALIDKTQAEHDDVDESIGELEAQRYELDDAIAHCASELPVMYSEPAGTAVPGSAAGMLDTLYGGTGALPGTVNFAGATALGYSGDAAGGLQSLGNGDITLWVSGSLSGITGSGATAFNGLAGTVNVGAALPLSDALTVGGYLGAQKGHVDAFTGGTVDAQTLRAGPFLTYRLPDDMTLTLAAGAAIGSLDSTLGVDHGSTATQDGFVGGSLSGEWAEGDLTIAPAATLFLGAEHQNAYTTAGGTAVPEQTVSMGSIGASTTFRYDLKQAEMPVQLFTTLGASYNFGGTSTSLAGIVPSGLSGSASAGVNITSGDLHGTVSAGASGLGSAEHGWSLSAGLSGAY